MIGILKGLSTTLSTFLRQPVTAQYPDERLPLAPRFWGFPGLVYDQEEARLRCTGCGHCEDICPTGAIRVHMQDRPARGPKPSVHELYEVEFDLNISRCMVCNLCVEVCPFDAIRMTHHFEFASYSRRDFRADKEKLAQMTMG